MAGRDDLARRERITAFAIGGLLMAFDLTMIVGAFASAFFASLVGAVLMLVGVAGLIGTHLVVAAIEYRRVMSRAWPQVSPLEDDDDD